MAVPLKPVGSEIEEIDDSGARTYRWKPPSGGIFRFLVAAFLLFWLCIWAEGLVSASAELLRSDSKTPRALLACWLGAWTIGGAFALCFLYLMLRPARRESITLAGDLFRYTPGSVSAAMLWNPWHVFQISDQQSVLPKLFRRRKPIEIAKRDLGPVVLDRVGERQRLHFDHDSERIEIGACLREPEREWLAAVIDAWKTR